MEIVHSCIKAGQWQTANVSRGVIIICHQQVAGQTVEPALRAVRQQNPISHLDPRSVKDTHGSDGRALMANMLEMLPVS